MKAELDIKQFIVSLLNSKEITKAGKKILHHALQEQGLHIKDGKIVRIPEPIEGGKLYMCIKDYRADDGTVIYGNGDPYTGTYILATNNNSIKDFWEYFRPFTEEDVRDFQVKTGVIGFERTNGTLKEREGNYYDISFLNEKPYSDKDWKEQFDLHIIYSRGFEDGELTGMYLGVKVLLDEILIDKAVESFQFNTNDTMQDVYRRGIEDTIKHFKRRIGYKKGE